MGCDSNNTVTVVKLIYMALKHAFLIIITVNLILLVIP